MNYKGISCPVCGQEFHEGDDVVVCPECGAPHHRACYKQVGHCAMKQELHEKGLTWQNPNEKPPVPEKDGVQPDENGNIICPNCGLFCKETDAVCPYCQFPLKKPSAVQRQGQPLVENPFEGEPTTPVSDEIEDIFGAIYEEDQISGIPAKDFVYIIHKNYTYFLRVFKIYSQRAKAKVFNWSAFFLNFLYFFYRKMYKIGAILLTFYILTNIPSFILSYRMVQQAIEDPLLLYSLNFNLGNLQWLSTLSRVLSYVRIGVSIYCGFTANHYYYDHCRQMIQKHQKTQTGGSSAYYQSLSTAGGTNLASALIVLVALVFAVAVFSFIAAAML